MALALDDASRPEKPLGAADRRPGRAQEARFLALHRAVAEVSANLELEDVFDDVLTASQRLFGAEMAGLWLVGAGGHPLHLAAGRNLGPELVEAARQAASAGGPAGMRAMAEQRPVVVEDPDHAPHFADVYRRLGIRTIASVPLVFRDEPIGLLVLFHRTPYAWTRAELDLCGSFAGQMATAVANARLFNSVREGAARLEAIQELSSRLNRIQDVEGIGNAIVAGADRLIRHDTIRVYRVDHVTQMCEPVAFQGEFVGIGRPTVEMLRVRIGEGVTGWVAKHNRTLRLGDAVTDARARQVGESRGAESMLLVPMSYEDRALGIIVVSTEGFDQFTDVRQGKRFVLTVDGEVTDEVLEAARKAAETLLSNPVIEDVVSVRAEQDEKDPGR